MQKTFLCLLLACSNIMFVHAQTDANTPAGYYLVDNPLGKIYFSNQPFTSGSTGDKRTFKSNEYIYARLKLNKGTVKEALQVAAKKQNDPLEYSPQYYFLYEIGIYKNKSQLFGNNNFSRYCLLNEADLNKDYLDFDVLPDPAVASTFIAKTDAFEIKYGKGIAPLASAIGPTNFPEDGTYKIDVIIRNKGLDVWGKEKSEKEWPTFESDFDFNFSSADVPMLKDNYRKVYDKVVGQFEKNALQDKPMIEEWSLKSNPPAIEGYTAEKYNQLYLKNYPGVKIVKTYLDNGSGWEVARDNNNELPIYKYSQQWVTFFCKTAGGECYSHTCNLRKKYEGGGKYGETFLAVFEVEKRSFNCSKLIK